MKISNLLSGIVLMFLTFPAFAQTEDMESIRKSLWLNYENTTLDPANGKIYYEQRLDRNPLYGLLEMRKSLADTNIHEYLPIFQGIIMANYKLGPQITATVPTPEERKVQRLKFLAHPDRYKFDFWIQPLFSAIFGYRQQTLQSNTSVLLQTQFYLWQGMVLNAGILFPITNDMDNNPKIIRPAPVFLNQFFAFGKNFISASAGTFYNDQYGVNVQYRHTDMTNPWSYGLEAGLTGRYYYAKDGVYSSSLNQVFLQADVAYRLNRPDVTLKLSGGQYLWKDRGARVDLIRQFTNVEIGVYAMKTTNGATAGFNFAIPIPPGKLLQGRNARLRTTDQFRWEYSYTRGFKIGERYRTGYQLDQKLRQYHTTYLNSQRGD
ncbi:YjbH domain-containing protein [Dyadobacter sp. CY356]|uniref:YjbH domain-containing protein n=1 Tax=Dyadobacter sp. CY356 TaxID=2906442 RepID=UPI001F18A5E2|nr:YjbH domain-containing protein [Dyadobacter sp. CY356]MCF0055150.1 YjbH domain-containing protein [Dyadobacter sp. CY356]